MSDQSRRIVNGTFFVVAFVSVVVVGWQIARMALMLLRAIFR